jgi:hypothetical protein
MSDALRISGIHHQGTGHLSHTELHDQHIDLLPGRTLLSIFKSDTPVGGGLAGVGGDLSGGGKDNFGVASLRQWIDQNI